MLKKQMCIYTHAKDSEADSHEATVFRGPRASGLHAGLNMLSSRRMDSSAPFAIKSTNHNSLDTETTKVSPSDEWIEDAQVVVNPGHGVLFSHRKDCSPNTC